MRSRRSCRPNVPTDFVATQSAGRSGASGRAALQDLFLARRRARPGGDDHVPGQRRDAAGRGRRLRPVLLLLERGGQVQLVYKHADLDPAAGASAQPRADAATMRRGGRRPEQFRRQWRDRGRPRRARGARRARTAARRPRAGRPRRGSTRPRALPRRSASKSSPRARVPAAHGPAGDPVRQGPGRGDRRAGQRAGREAADRRCGADPGPAEESSRKRPGPR